MPVINASKSSNSSPRVRVRFCILHGDVTHVNIFIDDLVRTRNHCIRKMNLANGREILRFVMQFLLTQRCIHIELSCQFTHLKMVSMHMEVHTHMREKYTKEIITGNVWFQVWICSSSASPDLRDEEKEKRAVVRLNYEPVRRNPHTHTHILHKYKHPCRTHARTTGLPIVQQQQQ